MADRIHSAFASIRAAESLKASTKDYLQKARQRRSGAGTPHFWQRCAAVCAMFLLLMGVIGFQTVFNTPVSYISIDVNPSIELTLNRWDRVISAEARNEDGSAILCALSVKGMGYTEAVDAIIDSDAMQPYLKNDAALTFTVASNDEERESVILAGIENCSGCRNYGGQSYKADPALLEVAHENGLSLGKYTAYLELSQYDATVTPEDCREMTMGQIRRRIRECQNGNHNGQGGNHNGQGQGGGPWGHGNHDNQE